MIKNEKNDSDGIWLSTICGMTLIIHNGRNLTGTFYSNDDGSTEDTFTIIK